VRNRSGCRGSGSLLRGIMWILPRQLHTSAFVPDTEALISDLNEQSQLCGQSLLVRSKPLPARTWSLKWKRDSWTALLSGRILKPSRGQSFVTEWVSSAAAILASRSQPPENDSAKTTHATSGLGSQMELFPCDPEPACSRMSRGTSASDSEKSSKTWKELVTKRRSEFSQRVKSVRPTNAKESSSWPTSSTRDHKGGYSGGRIRNGKISMDTLDVAVQAHTEGGLADQGNRNTVGSRQESWATATVSTGAHRQKDGSMIPKLDSQVGGKLNPRWVETLMGLPVGWTMPSCQSPVTIAQTNSDSSETELSQPPQSERSESSGANYSPTLL
jgi:hypothetical protein